MRLVAKMGSVPSESLESLCLAPTIRACAGWLFPRYILEFWNFGILEFWNLDARKCIKNKLYIKPTSYTQN